MIDNLEYMDEILGWIKFDRERGIITITDKGMKEYERLKNSGWYPFLEQVDIRYYVSCCSKEKIKELLESDY